MNLNQPEDFIDVFLESCYPEEEGWRCFRDRFVEGVSLDYVFIHQDGSQVWMVRSGEPLVSEKLMNELSNIAKQKELLMKSGYVRVAIVCQSLLLPPAQTPENVEVVSLIDQYEEFLPIQMPYVSCN
jgi:hypothetical protein